MNEKEQQFRDRQRARVEQYLSLREELGDEGAFETLMEGYPEQQRRCMGPYIENSGLAEGFKKVRDDFAQIGVHAEIVDVSTSEKDAAIEVLTDCMCANACDEVGMTQPLPLLCDLDFAATQRAFPEISVEVHHRMVEGAFVCVFGYSRSAVDGSS
jgi:predicted ArsR family transcriptional regulator